MDKAKHRRALLMLVVVTLIWGSGFIATQYAINSGLHTAWIMMTRFLTGAAVLGAAFFKKVRASTFRAILHGAGAGILLFAAFFTQTAGQGQTTVSNAAFITATNVIMIPFLVWLLTHKRPNGRVFVLCLITTLGVILLTFDPQAGFHLNPGDGLILLCAFLFALHTTYLSMVCNQDEPVSVAFWQLFSAAVVSAIVLLLVRPQTSFLQWQAGLLPVLYLGVFSTGVCYLLQTSAQKDVPAAQAGVVLSMEGVFGTLFSVLLGMDMLRVNMLAGGLLITLSVILMETKSRH